MDQLRRITDLFIEGREVFVGQDADGPVLYWVNKLNSFQVEETRADGLAARGLAVVALSKEDNPELVALKTLMGNWSLDELVERYVDGRDGEIGLDAINAVESMDDWREKLVTIRRMPQLLADQGVDPDDVRMGELDDLTSEYLEVVRAERERIRVEYAKDAREMGQKALADEYVDQWRFQKTSTEFMAAKRASEVYFALRQCRGTDAGMVDGKRLWDHTNCDHNARVLSERSQVKDLPDALIDKVLETLDNITVPGRESGNSDVPASSSASPERSSEEAASASSSPAETQPAVPTT